MTIPDHHATLAAAVARYFKARPDTWIDGRDVMQIAGAYGWRTRISDCRRQFQMRIDNRQRRVRSGGHAFTVSEYRYVPASGQLNLLEQERAS